MKVLLTSGGTKVKIDRVRHIGNMSRGTFPAKIAREMLLANARVSDVHLRTAIDDFRFLYAKGSRRPFWFDYDPAGPYFDFQHAIAKAVLLAEDYAAVKARLHYSQVAFADFDDYASLLDRFLRHHSPDLVVLAAAVSDYLVANYVDGKIRSTEELNIALTPAEKLIGSVKQKCPNCKLVGFKLMVDSTDDQLIEAAKKSIADNGCELVVANDLRDIQNDNHRVHLVTEDDVSTFETDPNDPDHLARVVAINALTLVDPRFDGGHPRHEYNRFLNGDECIPEPSPRGLRRS